MGTALRRRSRALEKLCCDPRALGSAREIMITALRRVSRWFGTMERVLSRIGRRQWLPVTLVAILALGASATLSLLGRIPEPQVHDEFSYLLAADTFAHGRLSNPTHPLWVHFESFHIIHQPSYASKYPPAQGLMLAAGQVVGGHPIVGVWIGTALACAAISWMLLAWLPSWWAVWGGFLAALNPVILIHWGQRYWGGTMALIGGALVFGALRRIMRRPRMRDALLMGVGLAILANSRPYEGLLVSLPLAVLLFMWMVSTNGPAAHVSIRRIVLPILGVLILTGGAMAFYNWRVTGDALVMPYQLYEETYGAAPAFRWQHRWPARVYRHKVMQDFYRRRVPQSKEHSTPHLWTFYDWSKGKFPVRPFPSMLIIPLVLLSWILRDRWSRFALLTCGLLTAGLLFETWFHSHYAAPMAALFFVLPLQAMRRVRLWRWFGPETGRVLVWTILMVCVTSFALAFAQQLRKSRSSHTPHRAHILGQLKETAGRHLVIVRYGPQHPLHDEWVYNEANIDGAKVVWAREMDSGQNLQLFEYFRDRNAWLVEVDEPSPVLTRYPVETVR
jgi:hypothetical protein